MTIQNPPIFIQAGSHPAEDVRRWMSSSVNDSEGVLKEDDLLVTEKSGTPDMSVDVAAGRAYVAGTEATYQGMYFAENRGSVNVAVAASDPTNPRIDLVVLRVRDSAYSGGTDTVAIEVVTGTPAASPVVPTTPDNSLVLANIDVAALASSIVDADLTSTLVRAGTPPRPTPLMVKFTASSTFVKADYPDYTHARVRVVGGGSAGDGPTINNTGGAGGGAGGYVEFSIALDDLAASETITVGAGGVGIVGVGGAGGASSFGSWATSNGGSAPAAFAGGKGGTSTTSGLGTAISVSGNAGGSSGDRTLFTTAGIYAGGTGGAGPWGGAGVGGAARAANADGEDGGTYSGAGGGGGYRRTGSTSGGNGGSGVVIIDLIA